MAAGGIFLSYRRDDSRHAAGRLADDLADHFGAARIFRDIEAIAPGSDFAVSLERALGSCAVMVVLIGPRWLDIRDAQGGRRLDREDDWIRQEIAVALQRGIPVLPVLLEGTPVPDPAALPEPIRALGRRQGVELSDSRWHDDVQRLARALRTHVPVPEPGPAPPPLPPPPPPPPVKKAWWKTPMGIGAIVVGLIVVAVASEFDPGGPIGGDVPLPMPMPAPQPVVSTGLPNIAGVWRTRDGEVYQFQQNGRAVQLAAFAGGQQRGSGTGDFDGRTLNLGLSMVVNGVPLAAAQCVMVPAPDLQSFSGTCNGPNGPFGAQFFR